MILLEKLYLLLKINIHIYGKMKNAHVPRESAVRLTYRLVLLNNVEGFKESRITQKYMVKILAALDSGRARLIACTMDGIASR